MKINDGTHCCFLVSAKVAKVAKVSEILKKSPTNAFQQPNAPNPNIVNLLIYFHRGHPRNSRDPLALQLKRELNGTLTTVQHIVPQIE